MVYLRDSRSPTPKNEKVSKVMSANKAINTKPEILLRKKLFSEGIRGYRLHLKNIPGRPDIVFSKKRLVIFVHGCFWHRCPHCNYKLPENNRDFWKSKFDNNIERDKRKENQLTDLGWEVLTIWECEIKQDISEVVKKIKDILRK